MAKENTFTHLESLLSQRKIPGLDGVRAIAIALVVIDHLHFHAMRKWEESLGRTGVTLFFVLSGFLITWLLLKENGQNGDISLRDFYIRRLLRIFPGFYFFWIAYVGLALIARSHISWGNCIAALFYVNNYYWALIGGGAGGMLLTWSLAVEEQFYIVWPSVFRRMRGHLKGMSIALAGLCVAVLLYRALLVHVFRAPDTYLYAAFDTRMDSLAMGCLLAITIRTGKAIRFVGFVCSHWILPVATFAALAASISISSFFRFSYWNVEGFSVESLFSAMLIVQMVVLGDRMPWKWINWRAVRFIGTISYSLYLYNAIGPDLVNHSPLGHTFLRAPLGLVASLLLATGSYYIVEKPFLRLKSKYEAVRKSGGESGVQGRDVLPENSSNGVADDGSRTPFQPETAA
jgi:peptidoglycan/LPS O-acetylase OafA/YrhL